MMHMKSIFMAHLNFSLTSVCSCICLSPADLVLKHTKKSLVSVSLVVITILELGEILMWLASPGLPYMWGRQFAICGRNSAIP